MKFKVFAACLLLGSLVFGAAWEQSVSSQNVKALVSTDKPFVVGNNTLSLALNRQNVPLENATVSVKAFMPAMPGMPAMESTGDAVAQGHGLYKSSIDLDMHGTWQLHIFVATKDGKKYRLKTSLNF